MRNARRLARLLPALTLVAMLAGTAVASASPGNPFAGPYESVDLADGSSQHLALGGPAASVHVFLFDDYGTVCETDGPGTGSGVIGVGTGSVAGDTLTVNLALSCFNGKDVGGAAVQFTDIGGALIDNFGTTWYRPGATP